MQIEADMVIGADGAGSIVARHANAEALPSAPLDDQIDERLDRRVGVLDPMRRISAAATAVAGDEFGRFIAHGDADRADGDVHMLHRAGSVGRGRPENGGGRDLVAHEVDAAAMGCGSQTVPTSGVFTAGTFTAT